MNDESLFFCIFSVPCQLQYIGLLAITKFHYFLLHRLFSEWCGRTAGDTTALTGRNIGCGAEAKNAFRAPITVTVSINNMVNSIWERITSSDSADLTVSEQHQIPPTDSYARIIYCWPYCFRAAPDCVHTHVDVFTFLFLPLVTSPWIHFYYFLAEF